MEGNKVSVYLSTYLVINIFPFIYHFSFIIYPSITVHLSSIYYRQLIIYLSIHPSIYHYYYITKNFLHYLSIYLSIYHRPFFIQQSITVNSLSIYISIYVRLYKSMNLFQPVYLHTHTRTHTHTYTHTHTHTQTQTHTHTHIYIYIYLCVCVCVCVIDSRNAIAFRVKLGNIDNIYILQNLTSTFHNTICGLERQRSEPSLLEP